MVRGYLNELVEIFRMIDHFYLYINIFKFKSEIKFDMLFQMQASHASEVNAVHEELSQLEGSSKETQAKLESQVEQNITFFCPVSLKPPTSKTKVGCHNNDINDSGIETKHNLMYHGSS
jgi:hypothetical protein